MDAIVTSVKMDRCSFRISPENEIAEHSAFGTPNCMIQLDAMLSHGSLLPIRFENLEFVHANQPPLRYEFAGVARIAGCRGYSVRLEAGIPMSVFRGVVIPL